MTPIQASKKQNEKLVYMNLKDNKEVQKPKCNLGDIVRTADIKRVFIKGDSTNWSFNLHFTLESHHISHADSKLIIKPNYPEFGIEIRYINKILKELSVIFARLLSQNNFKHRTVF